MRHLLATYALFALTTAALPATEHRVDLELVLAIDASTSVDIGEYALQLRGIARALRDPAVHGAIADNPLGRIAVSVIVWAEPGYDKLTTGWQIISSPSEAEALAAKVETLPRKQFGGTGIGEGVEASLKALAANGIEGTRRVIDVSGDGRETWYAVATQLPVARRWAQQQGVTINGLAIVDEDPDLLTYYAEDLATGPESFAMKANDFLDFQEAMRIKLIREISGQVPVAVHTGTAEDQRT